jgi:hypothetical protein
MNEDYIRFPYFVGRPILSSEYRIAESTTGFGWVCVEKWDGAKGNYAPLTSFRSLEQAIEFCNL